MDRRSFIRISLGSGGALLLASCSNDSSATPTSTAVTPDSVGPTPTSGATSTTSAVAGDPFEPNLFVRVDTDGSVTLTIHRSEMGQGVRTALAMVLADELDVDFGRVTSPNRRRTKRSAAR